MTQRFATESPGLGLQDVAVASVLWAEVDALTGGVVALELVSAVALATLEAG